ncbi:MAG: cyclic nucleotide-binding domain-containing protein [Alphaproteobacteria bacterium]
MSVCSALSDAELNRLDGIAAKSKFHAGETVFYEGDSADYLFNVTSGVVKVYKLLPDGRRQITGFLFSGDFLGLALHNTFTYSAEALDDVALCHFPRKPFERLLDEFPALEKRLLRSASNELAAAQDQMLLLGRKTARERLATFLLSMSERAVRRNESASNLRLPMGRADIGDYLGLTIETVSRTFTGLRKDGLIDLPSNHDVIVRKPAAIRELAGIEAQDLLASQAAAF